jgi:hypothetical protein
MPKTPVSDIENSKRRCRATISYSLQMQKISKPELAKRMGLSDKAIYNKFNNPDLFTRREIVILARILHLTDEQRLELIGEK